MSEPKIIGLTGGMGAGKSTLVSVVKELGIPVCDVDELVRNIYDNEFFCLELQGEWELDPNKDAKAQMAQMISQHPERLDRLEEIIGPWIEASIEAFMKNKVKDGLVFLDAPLLFEAHWDELCQAVIGIQCPIEIRKQRCMTRPGMTEAKFNALTSRQISEDERAEHCDFVIDNSGDLEASQNRMREIITFLKDVV